MINHREQALVVGFPVLAVQLFLVKFFPVDLFELV